jgi:hypothetical protein
MAFRRNDLGGPERRLGPRNEPEGKPSKLLVNPKGRVVARFDPATSPLAPEVTAAIERVLPAAPAKPR